MAIRISARISPLQDSQPDAIPCTITCTGAPVCGQGAGIVRQMLKLARTIADLAEVEVIGAPHLAEALQYCPRADVG